MCAIFWKKTRNIAIRDNELWKRLTFDIMNIETVNAMLLAKIKEMRITESRAIITDQSASIADEKMLIVRLITDIINIASNITQNSFMYHFSEKDLIEYR